MKKRGLISNLVLVLFLTVGLVSYGQEINITGKISSDHGEAIKNANVTLVNQNVSTVTDGNGNYSIIKSNLQGTNSVNNLNVNYFGSNLTFDLADEQFVNVSIYNLAGQLVESVVNSNLSSGPQSFSLNQDFDNGIYILKLSSDNLLATYKLSGNSISVVEHNYLATETNHSVDLITISAEGYFDKTMDISDYVSSVNTILSAHESTGNLKAGVGSSITDGTIVDKGDFLVSSNGQFEFGLSATGDLVILDNSVIVWSAGCSGGDYMVLQGDGNFLVKEDGVSLSIWKSNTQGYTNSTLYLADNGEVTIESGGSVYYTITPDLCPSDPNKTEPGDCGCGVQEGTCTISDLPYSTADLAYNNEDDTWSSGSLDISDASSVAISMDIEGDDASSLDPTDYLRVYYKVDGGSQIAIAEKTDGFAEYTISATGVSGNSLEIIVETHTTAGDEYYYVRDISVVSEAPVDNCPSDPNKTQPGDCGCGVADIDTDGDGTADCIDNCPNDANKTEPGDCGCGNVDTDTDGDGTADCIDNCPNDANKTEPGSCGCGVSDGDTDGDGIIDCNDGCPSDANKTAPGDCGCGVDDVDTDGDGTLDCNDACPNDANKTAPGDCGCGVADVDTDGDGTLDCNDGCPSDANKTVPGDCGCGVVEGTCTTNDLPYSAADLTYNNEVDTWSSGSIDISGPSVTISMDIEGDDASSLDPDDYLNVYYKLDGVSQVAIAEKNDGFSEYTISATSVSGNSIEIIIESSTTHSSEFYYVRNISIVSEAPVDNCPSDPNKMEPGDCGCGVVDTDTDGDGTADCNDNCPNDANKTEPGDCGCGVVDTDTDGDGTADCNDNCPNDANKTEPGSCGCGVSDADTDGDGTIDCMDNCPNDANKTEPGTCGCGVSDGDSDGDGLIDCNDGCPNDANKTAPGDCGCGVADVDTDGDGTLDCNDACPNDSTKIVAGECGCGVAEGTCTTNDLPYSAADLSYNNEVDTWSSGSIDISGPNSVTISMDIEGDDATSLDPTDYLRVYYKVDGGSQVAIAEKTDGFAEYEISATGVSGNSLEIIVETATTHSSESYFVRNISVVSEGPAVDNCPNDPNKMDPGSCGCGVPEGTCGEPCGTVGLATGGDLDAGPLVGHTTHNSAKIWAYAPGSTVKIKYYPTDCSTTAQTETMPLVGRKGFAIHTITGLLTDKEYEYVILEDDKIAAVSTFKTAPTPDQPLEFSYVIGSGVKIDYPNQPAWDEVLAMDPDFMVFGGDNVYPNSTDYDLIWADHRVQRKQTPNYAEAISKYPTWAVWDDHDFGDNNSGASSAGKENSLECFSEVWANDTYGTSSVDGIFSVFKWGDVEVYLMDNRYYQNNTTEYFGDGQMDWLEAKLLASTAKFKIIVHGGTIRRSGDESWDHHAPEFNRFKDFIKNNSITGVILNGGDVHQMIHNHYPKCPNGGANHYDFFEMVSSKWSYNANRYAKVYVNTTLTEPTITYEFIANGSVVQEGKYTLQTDGRMRHNYISGAAYNPECELPGEPDPAYAYPE